MMPNYNVYQPELVQLITRDATSLFGMKNGKIAKKIPKRNNKIIHFGGKWVNVTVISCTHLQILCPTSPLILPIRPMLVRKLPLFTRVVAI